jgi:hypothetical protein
VNHLAALAAVSRAHPRRKGLGLSPLDPLDIRKTVDSEISNLQEQIKAEIIAQIKPQLDEVASNVAVNAQALVHHEAEQAGQTAAQAARDAVVKYSIIAAGVGVVGGGLLGWGLAKKFR